MVAIAVRGTMETTTMSDVTLESGADIASLQVAYRTWGSLDEDRSNVILFPTWFSGGGDTIETFEFVGPGKMADTGQYFVVSIDALGNGVSDLPADRITVGDMVATQHRLQGRTATHNGRPLCIWHNRTRQATAPDPAEPDHHPSSNEPGGGGRVALGVSCRICCRCRRPLWRWTTLAPAGCR